MTQLKQIFSNIANSIRTKLKTTLTMKPVDFSIYIDSITTSSSSYVIRVAEITGNRAIISKDGITLYDYTFITDECHDFNVNSIGSYDVSIYDTEDNQLGQTKTVEISDIGVEYAKCRSMQDLTTDELSELCNKGDLITKMFEVGVSKWTYRDDSSALNNYNMLVLDFFYNEDEDMTEIRFCTEMPAMYDLAEGKQMINPKVWTSTNGTSLMSFSCTKGGWKYCRLRQTQFQQKGFAVRLYAEGMKPNNATLSSGVKISEYFYTDDPTTASKVYKFITGTPDGFSEVDVNSTSTEMPTTKNPLFVDGYFYLIPSMTEDKYNEMVANGKYLYFKDGNVYTPCLEALYDSSKIYCGFYKTLQEDGIFYSVLKNLDLNGHLVTMDLSQGVGDNDKTSVLREYDKVTLNSISELLGIFFQTPYTNEANVYATRNYAEPIGCNGLLRGMRAAYEGGDKYPNLLAGNDKNSPSPLATRSTASPTIYSVYVTGGIAYVGDPASAKNLRLSFQFK